MHARIQTLPPAQTSRDSMRRWLAQSLHDAEKEESKSLLAALTEERPSQIASSRTSPAPVLPSRAVSMASDGCVAVPPPPPPPHGRLWLKCLPVRALFDGGAIICGRAVVYHLLLGLGFEAAIGTIGPLRTG